ncbi:histidine kinase [Aquimarina sp. MAR_2010_214]|uniref:sensor histidine kinase n=1 Tax=Aquimarina sp. MAR_2010_214 TaxID=1250026 RepID=UPI000C70E5A5|nr:sensor histidine kinase [Aquimarina sp. MAR_2010_214]PKV51929.1 histidine kinase [Aquimarina sp. MAR_2010_214]
MKEKKPALYQLKRTDKIIFIIFFIIFSLLPILTDDDRNKEPEIYPIWIVLSIDAIVLVYLIAFKWLKEFKNKYYLILLLKIFAITLLLLVPQIFIYNLLFEAKLIVSQHEFFVDVLSLLLYILIISSILFGLIMFNKNIEVQIKLLKNESTRKSNELRVLKSQIDPHFLFNNLNTLDALIDTDVKKAKPYIERLAKLYQYLLATIDEDTVSLNEEIDFAKDYIYLIKERFGNDYQFQIINQCKKDEDKLIPPCAIQTAFENIIKHNNASKQNPITIKIIIEDEHVAISNNISLKTNPVKSFGIGLNNLQSRYKILCNRTIEVAIDDHYTITLPLIQKLTQ